MFEHLNFHSCDEVGHLLTERWWDGLPEVRTHEVRMIFAMWVSELWIPLWFVPQGNHLIVHTLQHEDSHDIVDGKLRWMAVHLGFDDVVIHRLLEGLPPHRMCGAAAILAHVLLNAPLPESTNPGPLEKTVREVWVKANFFSHPRMFFCSDC